MTLPLTIGRTASGELVVADLADLPNLLVAGSAGSAMNDWVHGAVAELCSKFAPDKLQLLVLNPEGTQLHHYKDCRHLSRPVCVSPAEIQDALEWVIPEMNKRFAALSAAGVRNIAAFNKQASVEHMPYLVILVDDLAGLMRTLGAETEATIVRLSALSRSTGIHQIFATHQPEASVLTEVIRASFTAGVAFKVDSQEASHLVLDAAGAEQLMDPRELLHRAHRGITVSPEDISRSIQGVADEEKRNQLRELLSEPDESSPCIPLRLADSCQTPQFEK